MPRSATARSYVVLACGTAVMLTFGLQAVAPALPLIQETFLLDDFQIGMLTSAYVLPGVLLAVPLGVAADLIGRRPVYVAATFLYAAMGILQGMSETFEALLIWRLIQGLAFASLMPLTVTVIGDALTGLAQVRGQAQRQVSMAAANMVVPVIGAQLAIYSWNLPFFTQSVMALAGVAAMVVLDGKRVQQRRTTGYTRLAIQTVKRRGFPSILMLGFIRFVARFSVIAYLPIHLTRTSNMTISMIGIVMGVAVGIGFLSASVTARVSRRIAPSYVAIGALVAMGVGLLGLALLRPIAGILAFAVIYGLADGFIAVLQSAYAARATPESVRAGLVAVNGMARNAGKFVGPLLVGGLTSLSNTTVGLSVVGATLVASPIYIFRGIERFDGLLRSDELDQDPS